MMDISSPLLCPSCSANLDNFSKPLVDTELHKSISNWIRDGFDRLSVPSDRLEQINAFVTDTSKDLQRYDRTVIEMERQLLAIKNARDDLRRRFDNAQSLIASPIRNLPVEALNEIFSWCCWRDESSYSLSLGKEGSVSCPTLRLSWVCSWWRKCLQSSPDLWSSIEVTSSRLFHLKPSSIQLFRMYLSNSEKHPLDFYYEIDLDDRLLSPNVVVPLDILLENARRWRRASLIVPKRTSNGWFSYIASRLRANPASETQSGNFPALEYLEIPRHLPWSNGLSTFFETLSPCPRLQTFHGSVFSWSGHGIDISHLRGLSLTFLFGESIAQLIRRIPTLESLSIEYFKLNHDIEDPADELPRQVNESELHYSSVSKLQIPNTHLSSQTWSFLRLPYLKHLQIDFSRQSIDEPFFSMLDDSKCQLQTLRVRMTSSPLKQALINFVTLHPTLVNLSVDFSSATVLRAFTDYLMLKDIAPNLRLLELGCKYRPHEMDTSLCSNICKVVTARCTIHKSSMGDPIGIYGLHALTLVLNHQNSYLSINQFVHDNLSSFEEAGFQVDLRYV